MGTSFLRAETRSVLASYRVDLALLRVGVFEGVVRLQGVLRRPPGLPELSNEALESLELDIRRLRGVRRVEIHLQNWRREACEWRPVEAGDGEDLELDPRATPWRIG